MVMGATATLELTAVSALEERLQAKLADDAGWSPMRGFAEMEAILVQLGETEALDFAIFRRSDRPSLWAQATGGSSHGGFAVEVFCPGSGRYGEDCFRAGIAGGLTGHAVVMSFTGARFCGASAQVLDLTGAAHAIRAWLTGATAAPGQELTPILGGALECRC